MTATRQHDETFVFDVYDNRLIVVNPRIGLPAAIDQCELIRAALFKGRRARDLPGDQRPPTDQSIINRLFIPSPPSWKRPTVADDQLRYVLTIDNANMPALVAGSPGAPEFFDPPDDLTASRRIL